MYNKTFLVGRLTRDPELRYTPAGIAVTRFTIAINRLGKDSEADFLRVVAWRKLAEICGEYMKKGLLVAVEGRLQMDSYEKDGEQISTAEIVADNMQMLERKGDHATATAAANMAADGDEVAPF